MSKYFEEFIELYKKESSLEKRVDLIWDTGEIYFDSNGEVLLSLIEKELNACKEVGYLDGEVVLRLLMVQLNLTGLDIGNIVAEINFVEENIPKIKKQHIRGFAYMFLGISSAYQGNYAKAFDCALMAKKALADNPENRHYGWVEYNLGVIHSDLKDYNNAMEHFEIAQEAFLKSDFDYGLARTKTGMATVWLNLNELDKAQHLYEEALKIFEDLRMQAAMSRIYNDLGVIYRKRHLLEESISSLSKALDIRKNIKHVQGIATTLNDLSESYIEAKEIDKAIELLNESVDLCKRINNQFKLSKSHQLLYLAYKELGQAENALFHLEQYGAVKDIVTNTATNNKIKELEKKAAAENAEKIAEIERTKKAELQLAFNVIEEKNKEILDSIYYAKRIQYTLLAHDAFLKQNLPEHFIYFQPKDIVSGDFYWANKQGDKFYLAVCDSTGHGVPGAFMSLLNIGFLLEAINEKGIEQPNEVFDYVRLRLTETMSKEGQKDGFDGILLCFDQKEQRITYAAANNKPVLISKGEIHELSTDRMPVGVGERKDHFTLHSLNINKGDILYIYTDGYADQFGGPKGKKFKYKQLNELLLQQNNKALSEHSDILKSTFENWKGDLEQVDDVCLIGIKF